MKRSHQHITQLAMVFAVLTAAVATPVFAVRVQAEENTTTPQETARTKVGLKLEQKKLEICQKRENVITQRLAKMRSTGEKQLAVFDKIFERVQMFKTDHSLVVDNYTELLKDVSDKQKLATEIIAQVSTTSGTFGCSKDDPKGVAGQFKDQLKSEITALKAYKTSLKDFLVAVKSSKSASPTNTAVEDN